MRWLSKTRFCGNKYAHNSRGTVEGSVSESVCKENQQGLKLEPSSTEVSGGLPVIRGHNQQRVHEDTAEWEDLKCAVVICRLYRVVNVL
jgi:hypothetical protein